MTNLGAAKRKLRAALNAIGIATGPTDSAVRRAHAAAAAATLALDSEVLKRDSASVAANQAHARKLAANRKDARGHKRPPQTMPGYHRGRPSPTKGKRFKATPPTVTEMLRMIDLAPSLRKVYTMECEACGATWRTPHKPQCVNPYSERLRAALFLMWRGGLRVGCELLRLYETDLHPSESYIFVERGKNDKARDVVVDDWVWTAIEPWLMLRQAYPDGPLFCVIEGPNAGHRPWGATSLRGDLHNLADLAGVRHRVAPHQLRHAMALEQLLEGVNPLIVSRNMGHSSLQVTDAYFQGLPQSRVVSELRSRPVPQVSMFDVLKKDTSAPQLRRPPGTAPDLMGVLSHAA